MVCGAERVKNITQRSEFLPLVVKICRSTNVDISGAYDFFNGLYNLEKFLTYIFETKNTLFDTVLALLWVLFVGAHGFKP